MISGGCHANEFRPKHDTTGECFGEVARNAPKAHKNIPPLLPSPFFKAPPPPLAPRLSFSFRGPTYFPEESAGAAKEVWTPDDPQKMLRNRGILCRPRLLRRPQFGRSGVSTHDHSVGGRFHRPLRHWAGRPGATSLPLKQRGGPKNPLNEHP